MLFPATRTILNLFLSRINRFSTKLFNHSLIPLFISLVHWSFHSFIYNRLPCESFKIMHSSFIIVVERHHRNIGGAFTSRIGSGTCLVESLIQTFLYTSSVFYLNDCTHCCNHCFHRIPQ